MFAFRVPLPLNKTAGVSACKLRTPDTRGLAAHSLQTKSPLLPESRKNSSLSKIPPTILHQKTGILYHILFVEFHFHVLDANRFGIPVIYPEKFCRKWVQMRKYQACVVYMPILLRICLAGAPTRRKVFLLNYGKQKK